MHACVFFDRDGIVNRAPTTRYVERREDFHILPGFLDTLEQVIRLGYVAVIVTNQKGVSTGATPLEELHAMHAMICDHAEAKGLSVLDILYCDAPEEGHPRRKPNPGMLLEAAEKHALDLEHSWMIGDNEKDVIAGQRAGCRTIFVGTKSLKTSPTHQVADMDELAEKVAALIPPAPEHT